MHHWQGVHTVVQLVMNQVETPHKDWRDWYRMTSLERMEELRSLCDPRIRAAILTLGIEVVSFDGLQ